MGEFRVSIGSRPIRCRSCPVQRWWFVRPHRHQHRRGCPTRSPVPLRKLRWEVGLRRHDTGLHPVHGAGVVTIDISCPGGSTDQFSFNIYIDPSGAVVDRTERPSLGRRSSCCRPGRLPVRSGRCRTAQRSCRRPTGSIRTRPQRAGSSAGARSPGTTRCGRRRVVVPIPPSRTNASSPRHRSLCRHRRQASNWCFRASPSFPRSPESRLRSAPSERK